MVKTANEIWRDFETDLMPDSGAHKPIKPDIREWGTALEQFPITGVFDQETTGSPWENITVGGKTGRISRIADRLMVGEAVDYNGKNGPTGGVGTWMGQDGAGTIKMDYLLINAGIASVGEAFLDLTTGGTSGYAILGAARQQGRPSGGIIGLAGYVLNDGSGPTPAWGAYIEAKRKTVAA